MGRSAKTILSLLFIAAVVPLTVFLAQNIQLFTKQAKEASTFVNPLQKEKTKPPEYVPGEVIVKFVSPLQPNQNIKSDTRTGITNLAAREQWKLPQGVNQVAKQYGVTSVQALFSADAKTAHNLGQAASDRRAFAAPSTYKIIFDKSVPVAQMVETLSRENSVVYAEPNYLLHANPWPNDPFYLDPNPTAYPRSIAAPTPGRWNPLKSDGTLLDYQWNLKKIHTDEAWAIQKGSAETIIAVVDSGIDYTHPDLGGCLGPACKVIGGRNVITGSDDPMDDAGHGTHVAGIIGAVTDNGAGVAGVCPNCKLLGVKFLTAEGSGSNANAILAIDYAVSHGAKIINASWGGTGESQSLREAIDRARESGVIFIAAAGNNNATFPEYPAAYPGVVSVAATTYTDAKAAYSSYGSWVTISAPGGEQVAMSACNDARNSPVLSTVGSGSVWDQLGKLCGVTDPVSGGKYLGLSGTSMAAPVAAGVAGLIWSQNSAWDAQAVVDQLKYTTDPIDNSNPAYRQFLGTGRVNAQKAVTAPKEPKLIVNNKNIDDATAAWPNGMLDQGERVNLFIALKNEWQQAKQVSATLSTSDAFVQSLDGQTIDYGDFSLQEVKQNGTPIVLQMASTTPPGYALSLTLTLHYADASGKNYTDSLPITLTTTTLDPSFGVGGIVLTDFGFGGDQALKTVLQPDGKIIAAGDVIGSLDTQYNNGYDFGLARYNSDGTLDTSFGSGGRVVTSFFDRANDLKALVLSQSGKIVAMGQVVKDLGNLDTAYYLGIARYAVDGSLDSTFGEGGKMSLADQNTAPTAMGLELVDSEERMVVAGYQGQGIIRPTAQIVLYRFRENGAVDTSFGTGGKVITDLGTGSFSAAYALAIQGDGKILVGGSTRPDAEAAAQGILLRYNPDGTLDSSFGQSGKLLLSQMFNITSLLLSPDGKILASGSPASGSGALARFNANGSLDTGFGNQGVAETKFFPADIDLFPDGRIAVIGTSMGVEELDGQLFLFPHFTLAIHDRRGMLDTSFGKNGLITYSFKSFYDSAKSGRIQQDGKVVLTGFTKAGANGNFDFALIRIPGSIPVVLSPTPTLTPTPAIFTIPAGTGSNPWNTQATIYKARVGETLRIINDDTLPHLLHVGREAAPCPHQPLTVNGHLYMQKGEYYDCVLTKPYDSTISGPLGDHVYGDHPAFWIKVSQPQIVTSPPLTTITYPTPTPVPSAPFAIPSPTPTPVRLPTAVPSPTPIPRPTILPTSQPAVTQQVKTVFPLPTPACQTTGLLWFRQTTCSPTPTTTQPPFPPIRFFRYPWCQTFSFLPGCR